MRRVFFAGLLLALCVSSPSGADYIIEHDPGGRIIDYVHRFEAARVQGHRVIVDGPCLSACSAGLRWGNVCATRRAVFGFHAAWEPTARGLRHSKAGTRLLMSLYPRDIRRIIKKRGGLREPMFFVRGSDLPRHYRC